MCPQCFVKSSQHLKHEFMNSCHSPDPLLHESTQNHVSVRIGSGNHIGLVVLAMSHGVFLNLGSFCEKDLSSGGKAR